MASTFKTLLNNDSVTTKTLLHEAIPITGALVSGTYQSVENGTTELNIRNYSHGMFQSVYDYPYLSSSANHIFDIAVGYSVSSSLSGNVGGGGTRPGAVTAYRQQAKKVAMYNQMAQVLMGHDKDGNIRMFDADGDLASTSADKMNEVIFLNFSRLLVKDEIKKGSFTLKFGTHPDIFRDLSRTVTNILTIKDTNAQNDFRINSPAGEYGILSASIAGTKNGLENRASPGKAGLIFYQAGVAVLTASIFNSVGSA